MPDATPPQPEPQAPDITLCPEDAAVWDALSEARANGAAAGPLPPGGQARRTAVQGVMDLLAADSPARSDSAGEDLVQATLARVALHRQAEQPAPVTVLCDDDARALDAVVANGHRPGPVPAGLSERAQRLGGVLSLLDQLPADTAASEADEDLVQRTLTAAADARQRERFAQQIEMYSQPGRTIGVSLRQVVAAAAVLLLGFSLLMPALARQRDAQQLAACSYNLGVAGQQMGQYALDHAGMLPRGPVGESWIKTGQADAVDAQGRYQSNSAHLYLLIRQAYVAPSRLACSSNERATVAMPGSGQIDWASPAAISYSYQNQHGAAPIRVDQASNRLAVLADKNPLFVVKNGRVVYDASVGRDAASALHHGRGQNILTLDGRVSWSEAPKVGEDNIWQIKDHASGYVGTEVPEDAQRDSFLVP